MMHRINVLQHMHFRSLKTCNISRDCRKTLNPQIWCLQVIDFIICAIAKIGIFGLFRQSPNISVLFRVQRYLCFFGISVISVFFRYSQCIGTMISLTLHGVCNILILTFDLTGAEFNTHR